MIDFHKEIVAALEKILPTHYEMVLHSGLSVPCISYMETNNYSASEILGADRGYSRITYQVKVWGNDIATVQQYALEVDAAIRALGFKRISSGELYDKESTMMQKIMSFEALATEEF